MSRKKRKAEKSSAAKGPWRCSMSSLTVPSLSSLTPPVPLHVSSLPESHLGGRNDGVRAYDPVGEFLLHFGHEEGAQARPGPPPQRVRHLKPLQAVAAFYLFPQGV
jgi:hypothetical protein